MARRLVWGILLLGVAVACSGTNDVSEPGGNAGGAGAEHSAGASAAAADGGSPDDGTPGGEGGSAGQYDMGGDTSEGGEAGAGGAAAVHFWTDATQHIEIACFGFFDGFATFRADRSQLSAEELELLAGEVGVPGSTYDDNDDQIHCVVTASDTQAHERQFTIGRGSALIGTAPSISGEGGAGGDTEGTVAEVLGCEFHHPFEIGLGSRPFTANPRCLREIWTNGKQSSLGLELATAGKAYHLELVHCSPQSVADTTVQLFGTDPATPLAVGVAPSDPGPDEACLALDAQVEVPVVGHLVFTSPSASYRGGLFVFR